MLRGEAADDEVTSLMQWLEAAGVTKKKLQTAREVCEQSEIDSIDDLRETFEEGTLDNMGFSNFSLAKIKKAFTQQ
eukprot:SAG11_NODE_7607_length_1122_cov_0.819159_2_plen_75_part_01